MPIESSTVTLDLKNPLMSKNALKILAERAAKNPKMLEMYKLEKEKYLKEIEKREQNGQRNKVRKEKNG